MTPSENERLATVEQQMRDVCTSVAEVKGDVKEMRALLIDALQTYATKAEVREVDERVTDQRKLVRGMLLGTAAFAVVTLVGIGVWLLQSHLVH